MVVGDISTGTDVLVIGAGPGGYVAAIRAGQLDLDVTLVEKDAYGGVCLNHGCIPSKALIHATDVLHEAEHGEAMGIHADPAVDLHAMVGWKDNVVDQLTGGVEKLCKANGVNLVEGRAAFAGPTEARVVHDGEGQGAETIEFENAIVATGSRPIELPGFEFDGETVLDSKRALALDTVPDRLVVIGAGYIGMELSTVFAKLGADVTVVEMLDSVLPGYEEDVSRVVHTRAEDLGIHFSFGQRARGWEAVGDGVRVTTADRTTDEEGGGESGGGGAAENEDGSIGRTGGAPSSGRAGNPGTESPAQGETEPSGETHHYDADRVLVAVGREPVTDTLDLAAAGLEPDDRGFLQTDHQARTDKDHIFAIGDVAGEPMLAHKASKEGHVAAEVIAGEPAALDYQAVPAAVFTDPEVGTVGMTSQEAEAAGFDPVVGTFPLQASGRALTLDEREGFVRIVADAETEFVLGAQIVGPEASELVAEVGLAIEMGAQLEDVAATIHTHPTLSEAVMEAAANARGHAIHTLNR